MNKVGVLTFHRCINYGSYWQARCLVEGLNARGVGAELLEHRSSRVDRAEWRCALQPALPQPTRREDHPRYLRKIRRFFDAFDRLPLSRPFALNDPQGMDDYSVVIVGSDEVWNLKHPWYGGAGLFYGEGLRSARLSAYAASFGNFNAAQRVTEPWRQMLRRFGTISVRDFNSRRLVHDLLSIEAEIVLDPVLQFPEVVRGACTPNEEVEPFIAVYGHSFPEWFQRNVRRYARAEGRRLVSIGYRNDWADEQWIEAGPEDFAEAMATAQAVATNFFHGCIFALLNGKPFACCLSEYRSNKISDLMRLVGADAHVMAEVAAPLAYHRALGLPPAPSVFGNIDGIRRRSDRYLDHVLP